METQEIKRFQWESCRQYAHLKVVELLPDLHGVTFQKLALFLVTAVGTSNSTHVTLI
jgi:hypothetical protein